MHFCIAVALEAVKAQHLKEHFAKWEKQAKNISKEHMLVIACKMTLSMVCCREYVEHYLTASFRSYAAVTPQDWQAYEEMRSLALDKHDLHVGAIDLPLQASDQRESLCPLGSCLWDIWWFQLNSRQCILKSLRIQLSALLAVTCALSWRASNGHVHVRSSEVMWQDLTFMHQASRVQ